MLLKSRSFNLRLRLLIFRFIYNVSLSEEEEGLIRPEDVERLEENLRKLKLQE